MAGPGWGALKAAVTLRAVIGSLHVEKTVRSKSRPTHPVFHPGYVSPFCAISFASSLVVTAFCDFNSLVVLFVVFCHSLRVRRTDDPRYPPGDDRTRTKKEQCSLMSTALPGTSQSLHYPYYTSGGRHLFHICSPV
ncbi:hypothetical protein BO79DRAFT_57385 [Aspergillus costaricaensis CBS 115574]|uniref:Uncharacterized protein n=1 Tax=Aspergillus costaricaensis CBS 115574 TaxID=1448317 RepID=A0ACD1IT04_9EURO|nr:hypothetical protein BO79DRAFT_57385 [Aspergillus costaricaensis CBS 115574]RAK92892.1 hypothetical protein BO79DRAFT_57385 [Aspergillus costaricaensis CBS 115574]